MAKRNRSTFERLQWGEILSRRERKEIERQLQAEEAGWEIVHRNVAGIDVGNESHFVAVDARQADQPVREFGSWTAGLHQMASLHSFEYDKAMRHFNDVLEHDPNCAI